MQSLFNFAGVFAKAVSLLEQESPRLVGHSRPAFDRHTVKLASTADHDQTA
jgi:hypothetical protein